jgi:hypothetical protein
VMPRGLPVSSRYSLATGFATPKIARRFLREGAGEVTSPRFHLTPSRRRTAPGSDTPVRSSWIRSRLNS